LAFEADLVVSPLAPGTECQAAETVVATTNLAQFAHISVNFHFLHCVDFWPSFTKLNHLRERILAD